MTIPKPRGRKPVTDRKLMLRIFVHESVIMANGGEEAAKEKCVLFLGARAKIKADQK